MISIIIMATCFGLAGYILGHNLGYAKAYKLRGCQCGACAMARSLDKCPAMAVYYDLKRDSRSDIEKSLDAYRGTLPKEKET